MRSKIFILVMFLATLFFTACQDDGLFIEVSGLESAQLTASQSNIVLQKDSAAAMALTLTWSKSALIISDTSMAIPESIPIMTMEVSASKDFAVVNELSAADYVKSFTCIELNTLATNMGFEPWVATPLYFRIKAKLGKNTDAVYSNVAEVNVTTYTIDMSIGFILDTDQLQTGTTLYSPNSDGEYSGFMGATAWYNYYLLEGDGTIWGNYAADGYEFVMDNTTNSAEIWNFWFPGQTGCYYTTHSTSSKQWTATLVSALSITGDISADMAFIRPDVTWQASFTSTVDNARFSISGISALYNSETGTDDAAAIAGTVSFAPDGENGVLFNQNGDFTVPGPAGDYTIRIDLSNPKAWTYEITSGTVVIVDPISNYLFLPGIDDGISGSWTFDNYLTLTSEDDSTFAGVVNVNSQWGYQMGLEADNWTDVYTLAGGDASSGTLQFQGSDNIPAPEPGLYLINADLKNMTYSTTPVQNVYYTGLNDDWSLTQMEQSEIPGVFTAQITINTVSEWGMQIFIDDQWTNKFGGENGKLVFNSATNITDDTFIPAGNYTLVVNLVNNTYYIVGEQLYVVGLNDVWDFSSAVLNMTEPGIYSGSVTLTGNTPWGYYFLLYPENWDVKIGGSNDALLFGGENIEADWYATMGTYTVTVDLINEICTVE
ncbi:MAG TPA: DUF5114 domain-containing protein [Prolixibacteraceae bacterium]|nr:DUF5114 domain-containing protein [Prolixibacteraceae bacterium]